MFTVGILTISDKGSRGEREDKTGPTIREMVATLETDVVAYEIVPDEQLIIEETLRNWVDDKHIEVIITTGGTGITPRDVTPEATKAVIEREMPGITQAMLMASLQKTPRAVISRAVAGTRQQSVIINLPGSPTAARENLEAVLAALPHVVQMLRADVTEH